MLRFLDVVFATFGEFVNGAHDERHGASGRNHDNLLQPSVFDNGFDFGVRNINAEDDFRPGLVDIILDFFFA